MASGDAQRAWFPEMTSKLSNKECRGNNALLFVLR